MVSLANAPVALYNVTWQNYFSNVILPSQRNAAYTLRTSMTFVASIVVIQLTGIILGSVLSDQTRIWLYQVCYWLALALAILQLKVLRQAPPDHAALSGKSSTPGRSWRSALSRWSRMPAGTWPGRCFS
jgi:hypothetical protein